VERRPLTDWPDCIDGTGEQAISISGETGSVPTHKYLLYPNPAKEGLFIESAASPATLLRWELTNQIGRSITSGKMQGDRTFVPLHGAKPGVYYLRIFENGILSETPKVVIIK
jgi:hypothetical protein